MNLKVGDVVVINQDVSKTNRLYTVNTHMEAMKGQQYKVDEIINPQKIRVNRWVWHPNDLTPLQTILETTPEKEFQDIKYDIKNLDI